MRSPAFQFYPADYLADMQVRMLSWASRGLYMDLLCYCWREGWIPADGSAIAQLCGCHDLAIVEPCLLLFQPHPEDPSKLVHKRLDEEKIKQDNHRNERSNSGKKGAESRWNKGKTRAHGSANGLANGLAIKEPMAKNGSSSSSSSSSSKRLEKPSIDQITEYGLTLDPPFLDASKFFDHYESNGWKVGKNPMKDWQATVRQWQRRNKAAEPNGLRPVHEKFTFQQNGPTFRPFD